MAEAYILTSRLTGFYTKIHLRKFHNTTDNNIASSRRTMLAIESMLQNIQCIENPPSFTLSTVTRIYCTACDPQNFTWYWRAVAAGGVIDARWHWPPARAAAAGRLHVTPLIRTHVCRCITTRPGRAAWLQQRNGHADTLVHGRRTSDGLSNCLHCKSKAASRLSCPWTSASNTLMTDAVDASLYKTHLTTNVHLF